MMRKPQSILITAVPKRISPTQVETARDCPLQAVLNSHLPEIPYALPSASPARYVGSAFHGLVECVRKGQAGDPPSYGRLTELWSEQIGKAEGQAKLQGDEAWLPLCDTFPLFERTRLRAFSLALVQKVTPTTSGVGPGVTETWLESQDGLVAGRLDAIDSQGSEVVLQDFKSGSVSTSSGEVKPSYRLQMNLYAAIYFEHRGNWPDRLELIDHCNRRYDIPFSQEEAARELCAAKELLRRIADAVEVGCSASDPIIANMATPSEAACKFCRHRPSCSIYLTDLRVQGMKVIGHPDFGPVDLIGRLVDAGKANGRIWIQLEENGRVRTVQGLKEETNMNPEEQLAFVKVDLEKTVGIFNAVPRRRLSVSSDAGLFVASTNTTTYALDLEC